MTNDNSPNIESKSVGCAFPQTATTETISSELIRFESEVQLHTSRGQVSLNRGELRLISDRMEQDSQELMFSIFSPVLPEHTILDTLPKGELEKIRAALPPTLSANKPRTLDKIASRYLADEVGILPQPDFIDLSGVVGPDKVVVRFDTLDLSALSSNSLSGVFDRYESVRIALGTSEVFIEKKLSDFEVYYRHDGAMHTRTYSSISDLQSGVFEWCQRAAPFEYVASSLVDLRCQQIEGLISECSDGVWYLKEVNGSLGLAVARLQVRDGRIESLTAVNLEETDSPLSADAKLRELVSPIRDLPPRLNRLILEATIPVERIDSILAEPRAVFNFNGPVQFLCSYAKVAQDGEVFPNRHLGGSAEPTRDSFRRMLSHHGVALEHIEQEIQETYQRYRSEMLQFAQSFIDKAREMGCTYGPLFAIDTCLVWNSEQKKLDFWLLEVQARPGTEGAAGNISPEEQRAVDEHNRREDEWDFEHLMM